MWSIFFFTYNIDLKKRTLHNPAHLQKAKSDKPATLNAIIRTSAATKPMRNPLLHYSHSLQPPATGLEALHFWLCNIWLLLAVRHLNTLHPKRKSNLICVKPATISHTSGILGIQTHSAVWNVFHIRTGFHIKSVCSSSGCCSGLCNKL